MSPEWTTITEDIKRQIVNLLDYESRCNLRICSKNDKYVVDLVKLRAREVKMNEIISSMDMQKSIIRIDIDTFTIWFIGKNEKTKVDKGWNGEVSEELSEIKQENRYEVARRYLNRQFISLVTDNLFISELNLTPSENWNINCRHLELKYLENENYIQWLNRLKTERLDVVHIKQSHDELLPLNPKVLKVKKSLRLSFPIEITDDQLEQIEAVDLEIWSSNLTENGMRKKIHSFLKKGKKDCKLEIRLPLPEDYDYEYLVPNGIIYKKSKLSENQYYFEAKLNGGFENIHGIQDARTLTIWESGQNSVIRCEIETIEPSEPLRLWPFTLN